MGKITPIGKMDGSPNSTDGDHRWKQIAPGLKSRKLTPEEVRKTFADQLERSRERVGDGLDHYA